MNALKNVKLKFPQFRAIKGNRNINTAQKVERLVSGTWDYLYSTMFRHERFRPEEVAECKQRLRKYFQENQHDLKDAFVSLAESITCFHIWHLQYPDVDAFYKPGELLEMTNPASLYLAKEFTAPFIKRLHDPQFSNALRVLCKALYWQSDESKSFFADDWRKLLLNYCQADLYDLFLLFLAHRQYGFGEKAILLNK